jgi:hypothetical protein
MDPEFELNRNDILDNPEGPIYPACRSKRRKFVSVIFSRFPPSLGMPESHVVSGLKAKRDEVKRAILDYEQKIKTARADLATLNEALAIFGEFSGNPKKYFERRQLFERGEL